MKAVHTRAMLLRTTLLFLFGGAQSTVFGQQTITLDHYDRYGADVSALGPAAKLKLDAFATALVVAALANQRVEVLTVGHADFDDHGRAFEVSKSLDRAANAENAIETLFQQTARAALLPPERVALVHFATVGAGTLRPITRLTSEDQRQRNRRVDLVFGVAPAPAAIPRERFENCVGVLAGAAPPDAAHRMTCVCNKLLHSPGVKDYFYESRAAQQARAAAGDLSQYTPGQLGEFYLNFMFSTAERIAAVPATTEADLVAGLGAIDQSITRSISAFLGQAAPPTAGALEHSVAADIERRTRDPNHTYSCYADYFRDQLK